VPERQREGDRTALRAAALTQRGLSTLLTLRWRGGKELRCGYMDVLLAVAGACGYKSAARRSGRTYRLYWVLGCS
jgi:hypothetical protein